MTTRQSVDLRTAICKALQEDPSRARSLIEHKQAIQQAISEARVIRSGDVLDHLVTDCNSRTIGSTCSPRVHAGNEEWNAIIEKLRSSPAIEAINHLHSLSVTLSCTADEIWNEVLAG